MRDTHRCAVCRTEIDDAAVALIEDGQVFCHSCAYEIERDIACPPVAL